MLSVPQVIGICVLVASASGSVCFLLGAWWAVRPFADFLGELKAREEKRSAGRFAGGELHPLDQRGR